MEFNLQQYLEDRFKEQKTDHDDLARKMGEGFDRIAAFETRLVVQENFRANVRWVGGVLLTCLLLPLIVIILAAWLQ